MMAGVPHITAGMLDALTGTLEGGAPLISETVGGGSPRPNSAPGGSSANHRFSSAPTRPRRRSRLDGVRGCSRMSIPGFGRQAEKVLARSLGEGGHGGEPETSLAGEVISVAIRGPLCARSGCSPTSSDPFVGWAKRSVPMRHSSQSVWVPILSSLGRWHGLFLHHHARRPSREIAHGAHRPASGAWARYALPTLRLLAGRSIRRPFISVCSAIYNASSTSMPRQRTVSSSLSAAALQVRSNGPQSSALSRQSLTFSTKSQA